MTSSYPDDTPRWLGYTHQDILAMVTAGRGREAAQFAEGHWHAAWFSITYVEANLSAAIADIGSGWEGAGATATTEAVTPLGRWALAGAEQALATSQTLEAQAGHAEHTRREMPPDPHPGLVQNPSAATPPDMLASWVAEDAARDEAAARAQDLMQAYTYNSYDTLPGMLESPPPPTVGVTVAAGSGGSGGIGGIGGGFGSAGIADAVGLGAGGAVPTTGGGPAGGGQVAGIGGTPGSGSGSGAAPSTTGGPLPAGGGAGVPLPTGAVPVGGLPAGGGASTNPVGRTPGPVPGAYGPGSPSAAGTGSGGAGRGAGSLPARGTGPDRAGNGLGGPPGVTGRRTALPGGSEAGRPGGGRWPSPEILPRGPSERWPAPGTHALSGRGSAEPAPPPGRADRAPAERPFTGAPAAAERSGRVPAGTVGPGMMPMGAGAGAGQGREHRRPPYLVDDGSAFAHDLPLPPPVINEDPEAHRV